MEKSASGIRGAMVRASFFDRREDPGRGASGHGNPAALKRTFDGSRIHSGRTLDAATGIVGPGSAAVTSTYRYRFPGEDRWSS